MPVVPEYSFIVSRTWNLRRGLRSCGQRFADPNQESLDTEHKRLAALNKGQHFDRFQNQRRATWSPTSREFMSPLHMTRSAHQLQTDMGFIRFHGPQS